MKACLLPLPAVSVVAIAQDWQYHLRQERQYASSAESNEAVPPRSAVRQDKGRCADSRDA